MHVFQKLIVIVAVTFCVQVEAAQWRKASDCLGMSVVTNDGENLGEVADFALDLESGEVNYVVVSVGSFLIKDALIAVAPAALSVESGRLVVASDSVASAQRFGEDNWPMQPDVLASSAPSPKVVSDAKAQSSQASSGIATISSKRRTATLSADERRIEDRQPTAREGTVSAVTARAADGPLPKFGALDKDRNGVLSRREIGSWLAPGDSYDEVDLDSSGTIDRFEFDIFSAQRK